MNMHSWSLIAVFSCLFGLAFVILFAAGRKLANKGWYVLVLLLLLLLPFLAYLKMGNWTALQNYTDEQSRLATAKALLSKIHSPQQLIDKLKVQLERNPNSARGWFLLGRIYASLQDWSQAEASFKKAYQLDHQDEAILINYAESLWQNNQQKWNENIRGLYQKALRQNPEQPDALTMLAMDAYLNHQYLDAIRYWKQLLKLLPEHSEDARIIQKAISKAEKLVK